MLLSTASILVGVTLKSLFGSVLTEEWKAWAPYCARQLMFGAVKRLPLTQRERYLEEWTADLEATPGFVGKLIFTAGLYVASHRLAKQSGDANSRKPVEIKAEAVKTLGSKPLRRKPRDPLARRPRVLVVDDDRVIANTLALILQQSGFDARSAYSGEQGLALARDFKPEMLITDAVMTGMTGIDTGIQIRSFLPECDVWVFGGQAATADLIQCAETEGHTFKVMNKPLHPADLLQRLDTAFSSASEQANSD